MPRPARPLVWLLGGYIAGLVAARSLPIGPDPFWPLVLALVAIATVGALLYWVIDWRDEAPWARRAWVTRLVPPTVAVAAFALGAISLAAELRPRLEPFHVARLVGEAGGRLRATVEARVLHVERTGAGGAAMLVEALAVETSEGRGRATGRVLVRVERASGARPAPGDRVRFTASLRFPRSFRNPGGYDARAQLALRQVRVVGVLRDLGEVTRLAPGGFQLRTAIEAMRDRVRDGIETAVRGPAAEVLRALVLGEDDDIPRHVRDAFQTTGAYHVLSISGLHMSLVAAAAFATTLLLVGPLLARLAPTVDARRTAALVALAPVGLYVLLAGAGIAAVRAALMAGAVLIALALGRRIDLWSAMALAALLVLGFQPGALFELGFLLSFGAVAAILRLAPWLVEQAGIADLVSAARTGGSWPVRLCRRAGGWVAGSMAVSAAAGLGTGPLLAAAFGRLMPWAPVANLVVVPLVGGFAVGLGLLGASLALIHPPAAAPVFQGAAGLLDLAIGATAAMADWPGASVRVPSPSLWEVALAYLGLWLVPAAWPTRAAGARGGSSLLPWAARTGILGVVVCLVVAGVVRAWPPPAGTLRLTVLDVGAGETALLELPGGERLLVDGGAAFEGGFDVGERVVTPFLLGHGIRRVDVLVLVQPEADRLGGLAAVARALPIGEVWLPPGFPQIPGELGRVLADRRVPIIVRREGDQVGPFGRVTVSILPSYARLAFHVAYEDVAIVFPPDGPGTPPPRSWRRAPGAPPLGGRLATILHWPRSPLPRYGLSPLLETLRPQVVLLAGEAGRRALRELPELIDAIELGGARALIPERDGAVIVTTDGRGVEVRTVGRSDPLEEGF